MIKKVAIIGAGNMAKEHIIVINSIPELSVVGITSRTRSRAEKLAENFNIPIVAENINELYNLTRADGALIAVNELSTENTCLDAMLYPWKLLVEKPVGIDLESSKRVLDFKKLKKAELYVAMNRRYYSSIRKAMAIIEEINTQRVVNIIDQEAPNLAREQGRPEAVCKNWHFANSIHLIDLFKVFCRGNLLTVNNILPGESNSTPFITHSILHYEGGDIGIYQSIWNAPGPWSIDIQTRTKTMEMRPLERLEDQHYPSRSKEKVILDGIDSSYKPGVYSQMRDFYNALEEKRHSLVSLDEYMETVYLTDRMYKSDLEG